MSRARLWWRDLALGIQLAFRGARTRTALTAVGIGLGVGVLLFAASLPNAIHHREVRESARSIWSTTNTDPSGRPGPATDRTALVSDATTIWRATASRHAHRRRRRQSTGPARRSARTRPRRADRLRQARRAPARARCAAAARAAARPDRRHDRPVRPRRPERPLLLRRHRHPVRRRRGRPRPIGQPHRAVRRRWRRAADGPVHARPRDHRGGRPAVPDRDPRLDGRAVRQRTTRSSARRPATGRHEPAGDRPHRGR